MTQDNSDKPASMPRSGRDIRLGGSPEPSTHAHPEATKPSMLSSELRLFALAVQFMTRLPVPKDLPFSDDLQNRSTKYFPLVGVLVGAIGAAVLFSAALILPMPVAVLLSLASTLLATGAIHEDGLADAADGLGGVLTRDRALDIMRDSRIGSYGAVTLVTALALKVVALSALPTSVAALALIFGHAISRMAAVHIIFTSVYARAAGAKFAAPSVSSDGYRWALLLTGVLMAASVLGLGPGALVGVGVALAAAWVMRWMFLRKLGGYTGDCLGAVQQVAEIGFYLGLLAWL